jgi:uncharacterized protein (TIGR01777 family)
VTIVIAGGSGFLGSRLTASLRSDGHQVLRLSRRPRTSGDVAWDPADPSGAWISTLDGADAVVNLAGESIEAGRWTAARKTVILESRVTATRAVVSAMTKAAKPPRVLLSASAVGFYGIRGAESLTETAPPGSDFLASVCVEWEARARESRATRLVLLRTGLPLDAGGGALPKLSLPFRLFAGGRMGSGRQYFSWIHVDDWVRLVRWAIDTADVDGPLNLTAPNPVTNSEFARTIGQVLHRPAVLPAPAFALRLLLGEMADALVLGGQRVLPAAALARGFAFRYPELKPALEQIFRSTSS